MSKYSNLTVGIYLGTTIYGHNGWYMKPLEGGQVFFMKGNSDGIIRHNQIDDNVRSVERELDPEIDFKEFAQLYDLVSEIASKFPNMAGLKDMLKKIVMMHSYANYGDNYSIEFPRYF